MFSRFRVLAIILLAVLIGFAGSVYWIGFKPNTRHFEVDQDVLIPTGASFDDAVDSLSVKGILVSPATFRWMAAITGWQDQIKAGHYQFSEAKSNYEVLNVLRRGLQTPVRLTIPPGTSRKVLAEAVSREMAFTPSEFLAAMRDTMLVRELGTDTTRIIGYMLPDTYFFYWLTGPKTVIRKIKKQFDSFYERALAESTDPPDLTPDEVVNLAAIVEWESGYKPEQPRIAGVYLNRLRKHWRLQADPTVQYAIMEEEGSKRRLLFADYKIDHPYNTYNFVGLPPGPITNPSAASIRAVLSAEHHNFFYFVSKGDGTHIFSRTMTEHTRAAREYYRTMRARRSEQQAQQ